MNVQNTVNNREGLLCAQSEDSGILIQHRTEPRINLREFGIHPFQTEAVKEKATIEVRTKERIKNNRLMRFVQYKKQPDNRILPSFASIKLEKPKNNHSSLRGTVSDSDKLLSQCYSEHQGNFSLMIRLPDNIQLVGLASLAQEQSAEYVSKQSQPLGVMPKRLSSSRPRVFSQFPKDIPASEATISNCAFNSGDNLIWKVGDSPLPFFVISLFSIDMYVRNLIVYDLLCTYFIIMYPQEKTPLNGATNTNQRLTTMLTKVTVMALYILG